MKIYLSLLVSAALFFVSCGKVEETTSADNAFSSAIFEIPSSFYGASVKSAPTSKSPESESLITATVKGYYNIARSQVQIAHAASDSIRSIIAGFENVSINGTPLFDMDIDIEHTQSDGIKLRWTAAGNNTFIFEKWIPSGGALMKTVEITLNREAPHYSGSVTLRADDNGTWTASDTAEQEVHWIKVAFDNDSDGNGLQTLDIYLQDFRFSADIEAGQKENAILKFTKDSAGDVTLSSLITVPGSPFFVWDGYVKDSSGNEIANSLISAYETRCIAVSGKADAADHATVNLAFPPARTTPAEMFTDYSIGAVLKKLFTDRLNNNYAFENPATGDYDEGHEIIAILNQFNALNSSVLLNETTYANTPDQVFAALNAANDNSNVSIEFLVGIMSVENPAYFNGSSYAGYGAVVPAGYIDPANFASLAYPAEADVVSLSLAFPAAEDDPGF